MGFWQVSGINFGAVRLGGIGAGGGEFTVVGSLEGDCAIDDIAVATNTTNAIALFGRWIIVRMLKASEGCQMDGCAMR